MYIDYNLLDHNSTIECTYSLIRLFYYLFELKYVIITVQSKETRMKTPVDKQEHISELITKDRTALFSSCAYFYNTHDRVQEPTKIVNGIQMYASKRS